MFQNSNKGFLQPLTHEARNEDNAKIMALIEEVEEKKKSMNAEEVDAKLDVSFQ